jgi:uncharacterized protein (DUF305 family)
MNMQGNRFLRWMTVASAIALSAAVIAVGAQTPTTAHPSHLDVATPAASPSPSTRAFEAVNAGMMKDMNGPYSGDADRDFVAQMIPHHRGAVSMAEIELKYGKDAEMRKLARGIIKAQETEIAFMERWLAKHPVR